MYAGGMAGTQISIDDIETIRDQTVGLLKTETADPSGASDFYSRYLLDLTRIVDWCEKQRAGNMPMENRIQGFSAGGR